jgi:hypothetical protein
LFAEPRRKKAVHSFVLLRYELPDIIHVIVLLLLGKGASLERPALERKVDHYCAGYACIEISDIERTLKEMTGEGIIVVQDGRLKLTERGLHLGGEWQNLYSFSSILSCG